MMQIMINQLSDDQTEIPIPGLEINKDSFVTLMLRPRIMKI